MAQYGWVLFFNKPEGLNDLLTDEERLTALVGHNESCFKQVEPLLTNGLRFASRQEYMGSACVMGPDEECLRLKDQIEKMGIGKMIPNTDCIRPV